MGETVNIGRMAEIVSDELFSEFGWGSVGVPNESWDCVIPNHGKKDHPTDVTFCYEDPYAPKNIHLIADLKSYAANSIKPFSLRETIESLALSVECAKTNKNWKNLYLQPGADFEVQGLLFIYNHDQNYDKNFSAELHAVFEETLKIPRGVRLSVLGPEDIWYLNDIKTDIAVLARKGTLPLDKKDLSFYYHSDSRRRFASKTHNAVASIDYLKGRYQILSFIRKKDGNSVRGLIVYYRGAGSDEREFTLLLDMMRDFGLLDPHDEIHLRLPRADRLAAVNFEKARKQYAILADSQMPEKLKKIKYASVPNVTPSLVQYEVALNG